MIVSFVVGVFSSLVDFIDHAFERMLASLEALGNMFADAAPPQTTEGTAQDEIAPVVVMPQLLLQSEVTVSNESNRAQSSYERESGARRAENALLKRDQEEQQEMHTHGTEHARSLEREADCCCYEEVVAILTATLRCCEDLAARALAMHHNTKHDIEVEETRKRAVLEYIDALVSKYRVAHDTDDAHPAHMETYELEEL